MTKEQEEKAKVSLRDFVTVEWSEKAKFHKNGEKSEMHRIAAKKLVAKGAAKIVKSKEE